MKKKIMAVCLTVCLAAVAVIGGTLAYFTDKDEAENVFTVGNVNIDLTEPNWDAEGSKDADTVYPGEPLKKDPTVTVDEKSNPCFVRISVEGLKQFGERATSSTVPIMLIISWVKTGFCTPMVITTTPR